MLGVPEMTPVAGAMTRPAGRPVADQVAMVAELDESVALRAKGVMMVLPSAVWGPGAVTATKLVMVQVKLAEPA